MISLDLIEIGPDKNEGVWLYDRAMGHHYRLTFSRGLDAHYRLTILDNHNTPVLHLKESFPTHEEAIRWARRTFIRYLMDKRLLPIGGLVLEG